MSLIKCTECGRDISDQATTCPNCGAKTETAIQQTQNTKQIIKKFTFILFIVAIIVIAIYSIYANNPINQYKKEAIEILESLKDKDITLQQAKNEIATLKTKFENTYKDKIENSNDIQHTTYFCFNLCLSNIETDLYLDSISTGITNVKINEYIKQIKSE